MSFSDWDQNGYHFADVIFKCSNENDFSVIQMSLIFSSSFHRIISVIVRAGILILFAETFHFDGLMQKYVLAMELRLSCINPPIWNRGPGSCFLYLVSCSDVETLWQYILTQDTCLPLPVGGSFQGRIFTPNSYATANAIAGHEISTNVVTVHGGIMSTYFSNGNIVLILLHHNGIPIEYALRTKSR